MAKAPGIAHVILAVEDAGTPGLTSYRRVILNMTQGPPGVEVQPPVELTTEQDHRRLMNLLGITSIRPGADPRNPQAPNAVNYDESKAGPRSPLPDPLVSTKSGESHRREDLVGEAPPRDRGGLRPRGVRPGAHRSSRR